MSNSRIRIAYLSMILLSGCIGNTTFAEEGYFGVNPGLNFYSMIDDGSAKMTEGIESRMLQERGTYGSLMRSNPCGGNAPWITGIPIDKKLLEEASNGIYSRLIMLARSRNVSLDSNSALALSECLRTSYRDLQELAADNQSTLEQVANIGLYTDGDASNSDYDIIDDISKINKLIFKEEEKYTGTKNIARSSLSNYLGGGNPAGVGGVFLISNQVNNSFTAQGFGASNNNSGSTANSPATISFGNQCSATGNTAITSVDNLVDDSFLSELQDVLTSGNSTSTNLGYNYGSNSPQTSSGNAANQAANSSSDFFHTIPCSGALCIKVRMIPGSQNLLGGGQNTSIEGIIERHLNIMGPISEGNLAGQKMTNNMYQLDWSSLKFSNIIPKPLIYVAYKPQVTRRDKNLDTKESKDAKLQKAFQCASYAADISSDPNVANMITGGSYSVSNASTDTNVRNTTKELAPTELAERRTMDACLDVAYSEGKKTYYQSFSTDITEIGAFTAGIIEEINQILEAGKRIDTLRVD